MLSEKITFRGSKRSFEVILESILPLLVNLESFLPLLIIFLKPPFTSKSENSIVNLEVGPASVYQLKLDSQIRLAGYNYKDLKCIKTNVQNSAHAVVFVVGDFNRMHCFCMASREQKDRLVSAVQSKSMEFMGMQIKVDNSEMVDLVEYNEIRLGDLHTDQALMSLCEFSVNKYSIRYGKGLTMRRTMCLTELAIVERDPGSYSPITAKALADVYCIVR